MDCMTLPTDSAARKGYPLFAGCFAYFPAALAGVARHSKMGNDKHNPGEPMHHARGKSMDHEDCILRHLMDLSDLLATFDRTGGHGEAGDQAQDAILAEVNALAWRALALSQQLHERFGGAPLAPGARNPEPEEGECYCDSRGLGDPEKSCGDCPTKDYPDLQSGFAPITEMTEEDRAPEPAVEGAHPADCVCEKCVGPFDLEKALAGHPLRTRSGYKVENFRSIGRAAGKSNFPYDADVFSFNGKVLVSYTRFGRYFADNSIDHHADLFMDLRRK